ncbi:MAG: ABC transporter permease [Ruminococcus sp.]
MKILNKFTVKNLKLNKSRTIVTVIGIMLSCALIMVVAGMVVSGQQTMIKAQINISGNYDLYVKGANQKILDNAQANRNVESIYIRQMQGCAYMPKAKFESKPYINVVAFDEKAYTDCFNISLAEGRLPQNDSELVLSQSVPDYSNAEYKCGDKITLDLGKRVYVTSTELPIGDTDYLQKGNGTEKLVNTEKKTYTIVGIFNNIASSYAAADSISASCSVFTLANANSAENDLFVKFTSEGEKNFLDASGQILNLSAESKEKINENYWIDNENGDFSYAEINKDLLQYKGFALSDEYNRMLFSLAVIIILIIMISSVFVIRNSFAISITEKTKLYGMLASIGATSKQIRHNVLFEGFVLGVIGIPSGLLLGTGVIALLVVILNAALGDMLNGIEFVYTVPWWVAVVSAGLSAIIILLSTLSSAFRASRIAPITAIRSNEDIKINKKRRKSYKVPEFIKKLFGIGGEIAYKNLKRNKKRYRTTVISIIVTVTMFISISTFIEYGMKISSEYIKELPYTMIINTQSAASCEEIDKIFDKIYPELQADKEIRSYTKAFLCSDAEIDGLEKYYTAAAKENSELMADNVAIYAVNDEEYKDFVKRLGYDYDEVKDKALITNSLSYYDSNNILHKGKCYDMPKNTVVDFYPNGQLKYTEEEIQEYKKLDPDFESYSLEEYYSVELEIYGTIDKEIENCVPSYILNSQGGNTLIVSEDTFRSLFRKDNIYMDIFINSDNTNKMEENISNLDIENISVFNLKRNAEQSRSVVMIIAIFAYGFIIVISLIGITNVFNTINTSMRLRSKEFAMLKSIGMTKKEFNRMIRLESLFYGVKSLLFGIPLGLLGGYAIFRATGNAIMLDYAFPTMAVLISIVFVFCVVWIIMRTSISKVNKQNIIETIRNDNI